MLDQLGTREMPASRGASQVFSLMLGTRARIEDLHRTVDLPLQDLLGHKRIQRAQRISPIAFMWGWLRWLAVVDLRQRRIEGRRGLTPGVRGFLTASGLQV